MSRGRGPRKITAARNRELQVAAAVAREAILQLHVERALDLIQHGAGRVSTMRMLDIYLRLLALSGPTAEVVVNRVLASVGRRGAGAHGMATPFSDSDDDVDANTTSLLHTIKTRLRGRVHDTLRRTVELQTGVTQAALLDVHVQHAHNFVKLLADTHSIEAACATYVELVHVPSALTPVLYILVLKAIAAAESPRSSWTPAQPTPVLTQPERAPEAAARGRHQPQRQRRPA